LVETDAAVSARGIVARVVAIRAPGGRVLDLERFPGPLIAGALASVARIPGPHTIACR